MRNNTPEEANPILPPAVEKAIQEKVDQLAGHLFRYAKQTYVTCDKECGDELTMMQKAEASCHKSFINMGSHLAQHALKKMLKQAIEEAKEEKPDDFTQN